MDPEVSSGGYPRRSPQWLCADGRQAITICTICRRRPTLGDWMLLIPNPLSGEAQILHHECLRVTMEQAPSTVGTRDIDAEFEELRQRLLSA